MSKISSVKAREILDSRGNPTIEVEIITAKGILGREQVPSGASTGVHEAIELRDNLNRYGGKGVLKAVDNIKKIEKEIKGIDVSDQEEIDQVMIDLDGTLNKSKLGANAILGVSLACARANSIEQKKPLYSVLGAKNVMPIPFMNVINGGVHADNKLSFQEFMIVPTANTFAERLRIGTETYHELKKVIAKKYGKSSTNVGDEGGFAPNLNKVEEALELLSKTVENLGYSRQIKFAIDAAASEFYHHGKYEVDSKMMDAEKLTDFYIELIKKYPIISLEDPFSQDDFKPWSELTKKVRIQIVGDDLLVTNPNRILMAQERRLCNALLLKVNQIGTLSQSIKAAKMAQKANWNVMVSHRSGETESTFISDLVVGLGVGQIKSGAPCRTERVAKYNQLLRIEEELGKRAKQAKI